jgi:hypothetical protein
MLGNLFCSPLVKQGNTILVQNEMSTVKANKHYMELNKVVEGSSQQNTRVVQK